MPSALTLRRSGKPAQAATALPRRDDPRGAFVSVVFLFLWVTCVPGHAARYLKVAGRLDITSVHSLGKGRRTPGTAQARWTNQWTVSFVATVGTNEWQLEGNWGNARQKWCYDGANVCSSDEATGPPPAWVREAASNRLGLASVPLQRDSSNLTVSIHVAPGGYLPGDVGVNLPWLALCSGAYLRRPGRLVPLPVAYVGHAPDAFGYADKTETFPDELGLPRRLDLFASAPLYGASVRAFWPELKRPPLLGHRDGERKFHFLVTQSTNVMGWHIPLAFAFAEDFPADFDGLLTSRKGNGTITTIRASLKPEGVFDPARRQTVLDFRFQPRTKDVNGLIYGWTNAVAASTNNPVLLARFTTTVKRAPLLPALRRRRARWVVGLLLALAAGLPVGALLLRRDRKEPT